MFLRNQNHGEAMLELRGREFHIYAEAVWPEYFMNVLRRTLHKLIQDSWPGLEDRYYFAVPYREWVNDTPCEGRFEIDSLRQFLEEGDDDIRCQRCRTRQNIVELLFGFQDENSRDQLARIEAGIGDIQGGIEGLESRLADALMAIMIALANEAKNGPRLFTVEPVDGDWRQLVSKRYRLKLWCEAEGCQHPVLEDGKGAYEFQETREWVRRVAPYANFVSGLLRTAAQVALPAANLLFTEIKINELGIKNHLDLVKEGTGALLRSGVRVSDPSGFRQGMISEEERSGLLWLHAFLRENDPYHETLGLTRVPTYPGDFLWLCPTHYEQSQSKIPEKF